MGRPRGGMYEKIREKVEVLYPRMSSARLARTLTEQLGQHVTPQHVQNAVERLREDKGPTYMRKRAQRGEGGTMRLPVTVTVQDAHVLQRWAVERGMSRAAFLSMMIHVVVRDDMVNAILDEDEDDDGY